MDSGDWHFVFSNHTRFVFPPSGDKLALKEDSLQCVGVHVCCQSGCICLYVPNVCIGINCRCTYVYSGAAVSDPMFLPAGPLWLHICLQ